MPPSDTVLGDQRATPPPPPESTPKGPPVQESEFAHLLGNRNITDRKKYIRNVSPIPVVDHDSETQHQSTQGRVISSGRRKARIGGGKRGGGHV